MDIFKILRKHDPSQSPTEEQLYALVAAELGSSMIRQGLWTKALTDSDWNESRAKALYVRMRVPQLRDELLAQAAEQRLLLCKTEAAAFGLSTDEIDYIGTPIKAIRYVEKYGVSKDKLANDVAAGRLRYVFCRDVLWVEDRRLT